MNSFFDLFVGNMIHNFLVYRPGSKFCIFLLRWHVGLRWASQSQCCIPGLRITKFKGYLVNTRKLFRNQCISLAYTIVPEFFSVHFIDVFSKTESKCSHVRGSQRTDPPPLPRKTARVGVQTLKRRV